MILFIERIDGGISFTNLSHLTDPSPEIEKLLNLTEHKTHWVSEELPTSFTYRNAWVNNSGAISIDLEKAKEIQKERAAFKALERVSKDLRGNPSAQELAAVDAEIEALDFSAAQTIDDVFNTWPASIDVRNGKRTYTL
jgi:hypothetical protein